MSEAPNVTPISDAFKRARRLPKVESAPPVKHGGGGGDGDGGELVTTNPPRLPEYSSVTALGYFGMNICVLDRGRQFHMLPAEKLGRLNILKLFGGKEFLVAHWPAYDKKGKPKDDFEHGELGPVIIASCEDAGMFNPVERVRGPGAWVEEDGALAIHCGDRLQIGPINGRAPEIAGTGLRKGMLYSAAPALAEPILNAGAGASGPAARVLAKLESWNWARGPVDAKLALAFVGAAKLAAAPDWRPMLWVTGGFGTGKTTFQKFVRLLLGERGYIRSENATKAYIFQRIAYSSLPVLLDEFESQANNQARHDIIDLARLAASGAITGRGGQNGVPMDFTAKNCFLFSSILIPPLKPADRSRMAILELNRIVKSREPGEDDAGASDVLGDVAGWEKCGRELSGRLLTQWPRYHDAFAAYWKALEQAGHNERACDQFGALGAAYDLLMHDRLDDAAPAAWAALLPAASMAETSGYLSEERACLQRLSASPAQLFREGTRGTVGKWLRDAKKEREGGVDAEAHSDANRVMAEMGLKLYRDARMTGEKGEPWWWVAVSNTHEALARIFYGTQWGGLAGAPGTWSQALKRLNDAHEVRVRIDGQRHYCVAIPWEEFFPPDGAEDAGEKLLVDKRDRE